ncbi:endonuclease/exonuclease/phosphatase family protein [Actinospongicola halichondriae]|uniref:endonuclease/exonuclease/phosphatase family protein n=1 Tax=Actinospongicola halichondriae TaxID=3236844 RepID=UPI003D48FD34
MDDPATATDLIETRVRVATWNLWWRFGPWEERLPRIIEELRRVDADVVALQEVWSDGNESSASIIAEALGLEVCLATTNAMEPDIGFGNAVLSRWPIAGQSSCRLPAGDAHDEQRLVLRADVDGPRGPIQVFSTHLNWRFDHSAIRQEQADELTQFVADSRPRSYPPIVCGDFNAEPTSDEMRTLTGLRPVANDLVLVDCWRSIHPDDPGYTWNNENPFVAEQLEFNRRIDYVLAGWPKRGGAGNPVGAELLGVEQMDGMWPSDHYGVVADLRY